MMAGLAPADPMTPTPRSLRCLSILAAAALLGPVAHAQTATWIASGANGNPTASADWNDPANWDTGAVPNGGAATAVVTRSTFANDPDRATAQPVITGSITVGRLQFDLSTPATAGLGGLYVGSTDAFSGAPGTLRVEGTGLDISSHGAGAPTAITLHIDPGSVLEFAGQAVLARSGATTLGLTFFGLEGSPATLRFRDSAAIRAGALTDPTLDTFIGSVLVEFRDQSRAGDASLALPYNVTVNFLDQASAGTATLTTPVNGFGSSGRVFFSGDSTASHASLGVLALQFSDRATAGFAAIANAGLQYYSSHGAFIEYYADLSFLDHSTAGHAVIDNNRVGRINFADNSSAESALITNRGTIFFSGNSSLAQARLISADDTIGINLGYNQAGTAPTGRIVFQDQATGGSGRIEITGANSVIDFSGLRVTAAGSAGRALLPSPPTGAAVLPDDASSISFGAITNTAPGGTIYLGGSRLRIGSDGSSMLLSARVADVGGIFGTLAGQPLQGGGLDKVGAGVLTISNPNNSYSGLTWLLEGGLKLDTGRVGPVSVGGGTTLSGNGIVAGNLTNGGTVSPGNSPGTITVQGNYTQTAGSTLAIELASATSYDHLVVSGTATLGGNLKLTALGNVVPVGSTTFNFLQAGAVSGQFAAVQSNQTLGAALAGQVVYSSTGVSLQITQKPFTGFGSGPTAAALGAHLDATLAGATGTYRSLLAGLNTLGTPAEIAAALDALAPDRYSAITANGFAAAAAHQASLDQRLTTLRETTAPATAVFFEAGFRQARYDATDSLPRASARVGRGTAGLARSQDDFSFGASITQESGPIDLDPAGSRAEVRSLAPAVFLQYAPENFFVQLSAGVSRDDYTLRRRIAYSGTDLTAAAAPHGQRTDVALTFGRGLTAGGWTLTPNAGLLSSRLTVDDFTETGAPGANVAITGWTNRSLRSRVGLEVARNGPTATPRLSVTWLHEFDDDRSFGARLADAGGNAYTAPGRAAETDVVQASFAVDVRLARNAALRFSLAGAWGRNSAVTSDVSAGFHRSF